MIVVIAGKPIKYRWGQWYRHDAVHLDGKPLEGFVQVRRKYFGKRIGHRIETITCFKNSCVMGRNLEWLAKQNKDTTNG